MLGTPPSLRRTAAALRHASVSYTLLLNVLVIGVCDFCNGDFCNCLYGGQRKRRRDRADVKTADSRIDQLECSGGNHLPASRSIAPSSSARDRSSRGVDDASRNFSVVGRSASAIMNNR